MLVWQINRTVDDHWFAESIAPEAQPYYLAAADLYLQDARELAKENGIDARCAELMHQVFEEAVARGDGDRYTPVIRRGLVKGKA